MTLDDKAGRLVDYLQIILLELKGNDKKNESVCQILSPQEIAALRVLCAEGALTMSRIAEGLALSLSGVTALVDKLVEKKLVRRERSAVDRRIVRVEATAEGKRLNRLAVEGQINFAQGLLGALNAKEQNTFLALFKKISREVRAAKEVAAS